MPSMGDYIDLVKLLLRGSRQVCFAADYFCFGHSALAKVPQIFRPEPAEKFPGGLLLQPGCVRPRLFFDIPQYESALFVLWHAGLQHRQFRAGVFPFPDIVTVLEECGRPGKTGSVPATGSPSRIKGIKLLDEAKAMRGYSKRSFEQFYKGGHYFFYNQPDRAAPLLEEASTDPSFGYKATKLLAIIQLDRNQPAEAARLMDPF